MQTQHRRPLKPLAAVVDELAGPHATANVYLGPRTVSLLDTRLANRGRRTERLYLVHFEGLGEHEDDWYTPRDITSDVDGGEELLREFNVRAQHGAGLSGSAGADGGSAPDAALGWAGASQASQPAGDAAALPAGPWTQAPSQQQHWLLVPDPTQESQALGAAPAAPAAPARADSGPPAPARAHTVRMVNGLPVELWERPGAAAALARGSHAPAPGDAAAHAEQGTGRTRELAAAAALPQPGAGAAAGGAGDAAAQQTGGAGARAEVQAQPGGAAEQRPSGVPGQPPAGAPTLDGVRAAGAALLGVLPMEPPGPGTAAAHSPVHAQAAPAHAALAPGAPADAAPPAPAPAAAPGAEAAEAAAAAGPGPSAATLPARAASAAPQAPAAAEEAPAAHPGPSSAASPGLAGADSPGGPARAESGQQPLAAHGRAIGEALQGARPAAPAAEPSPAAGDRGGMAAFASAMAEQRWHALVAFLASRGGAAAAHLAQDRQLSGREPGRATARWARPAPGPECGLAGNAALGASAQAGGASGGAAVPAVGDKRAAEGDAPSSARPRRRARRRSHVLPHMDLYGADGGEGDGDWGEPEMVMCQLPGPELPVPELGQPAGQPGSRPATPCPHAASLSDEFQDVREDVAELPDAPEPAHLVPDTCSPDDAEPLPAAAQGAGAHPNPAPDPGPAAAPGDEGPAPDGAAELGGAAGAGGLRDAGDWEEVAPMDAAGGDDVAAGTEPAELPGVGAGAAAADGAARLGGAAGAGGLRDAGDWEEVAPMDAAGGDNVAAGAEPAELPGVGQPDSGHRAGVGAGAAADGAHDLGDQGVLESGVPAGPGGAAGAAHGGAGASGSESEGEALDEFGLNAEERGYLDDAALWHADANIINCRLQDDGSAKFKVEWPSTDFVCRVRIEALRARPHTLLKVVDFFALRLVLSRKA